MKNTQQTKLFEQLCEKHGSSQVVQELKQLLHLEKSALYKRINGEKELTFDELMKIANHFGVSLDRLRSSERTVVFEFPGEKPTQLHSPVAFLENIATDMQALKALPQLRIRYVAAEIPLFHYFQFPELTLFKLYQWNRIAWRKGGLMSQKFVPDPEKFGGTRVLEAAETIHQLYRSFDTSEIWATSILDNTLAQIVFTAQIEQFETLAAAQILLHQLSEVANNMEKFAEAGEKPSKSKNGKSGKLEAFHNPTAHSNNLVLIENGSRYIGLYSTFDNPNFLRSTDADLCEYASNAFHRLASVSENISLASEKNRKRFFKELRDRVEQAKHKCR